MQNYKIIQYVDYARCIEVVFIGIVSSNFLDFEIKICNMLQILM